MKAHFRFATEILKRLGEELNPDVDQSILELAKNAYDADARKCLVVIDSKNKGEVRIIDNGDGMSVRQIRDAWLLLGKSTKTINKRTRLNRIPAGNKGLGRLAALRMGRWVVLTTRTKTRPSVEHTLEIDWKRFESAKAVENIPLEISSGRSKKLPFRPGTSILLRGIKKPFTEAEVRRIIRGLLLLADPFGDDPAGFKPILKAREFKKLEKLVRRRYFDDAEIHLQARLDEKGFASAVVVDWQGRELYSASHAEIRPRMPDTPYGCPSAVFDLWVFLLSGEHFSTREASLGEVREWLKEFGGVHLYIRGLRVPPYGNSGNDWLDMNLVRARDPELRPSTNTSIGRISTDDPKEKLFPKTDRSGVAETEVFQDLRSFAVDALNWMARRRMDERNVRLERLRDEAFEEIRKQTRVLENWLQDLPVEKRRKATQQIEKLDQLKNREAELLKKQLQLYRLLGSAGIAASVFAHESKHSVDVIARNAKLIGKLWKKYSGKEAPDDLRQCIERIRNQSDALQTFGGLTLSFVNREKRRLGRVEVHKVINDVLGMFGPLVLERKVSVRNKLVDGNPYLRASEANLESVIANLLVNCLKAFERLEPGERLIEIRTHLFEKNVVIRVLDNGPGIRGLPVKDIWLPGETTYADGTGLGLTIVRDSIVELGGTVEAKSKGELGGAEIIVQLPILGS